MRNMPQKTSKISRLEKKIEGAENVGFDIKEKQRCGSFVQTNNKVNYSNSKNKGVEIISTSVALKKYTWLKKYLWKLVDKNKDKYTKEVLRYQQEGYFIRAKKGVRAEVPVQACLYLKGEKSRQRVHNIIIAEEGSSLNIINGCTTAPQGSAGVHIGVSEFFVKKNAFLSFSMIHNWSEETTVRPRSAALVEGGGTLLSNYVSLKQVKDLQMYPIVWLAGSKAVCRFSSVLLAPKNTLLDVGAGVVLGAPKTKAEIISRAISNGGKIIARGKITGEGKNVKAHLECKGLILDKKGQIYAIPELEGKSTESDLSHEAAVGKINEEEIEYLMARGLSRQKATAMIIRGFLNIDIKGLPENLEQEIKKTISLAGNSF